MHRLKGNYLYSIHYDPTTKGCSFEMHCKNKGMQVHPAVLSWLGKNWCNAVGAGDCSSLDCFTKYTHKNGTNFWSHPYYQSQGPWYN
jgi:hypothetical protein